MEQVKFLPLLIICVQTATGFIWNSSTASISVCVGNTIPLDWAFTLESGEFHHGTSWTKSDGAGGTVTLAKDVLSFKPAPAYVGRLTNIGNAGIEISNATSSDIGTYTVCVALTSGRTFTMNATVHVHEIANASCVPSCDSRWTCQIPQACPVKNDTDAIWTVDGVKHPNEFHCSPNNYNKPYNVCAEGNAVTSCYRGSALCREENVCRDGKRKQKQTDFDAYVLGLVHCVGIGVTFQGCWILIPFLISSGTTSCTLELGLGFGLCSGILYVITIITAVKFVVSSVDIPNRVELGKGMVTGLLSASVIGIIVVDIIYGKRKQKQTGYKHAYCRGLVRGVGLGVIFQYGWIIIASLIFTCTTSCKLELGHGLGLGLGSGMPLVITIIIAVFFVFSSVDIPNRVELGKGMVTGLLSASVIGIIVVDIIYDKLKPEQTSKKCERKPLNQNVLISKTTNSGAGNPV